MLALNSHESMFNDGDFDYFQYFGQKKTEEAKWRQLQDDDVSLFKKNRSDLVITEKDKDKGIYVLKQSTQLSKPTQTKPVVMIFYV